MGYLPLAAMYWLIQIFWMFSGPKPKSGAMPFSRAYASITSTASMAALPVVIPSHSVSPPALMNRRSYDHVATFPLQVEPREYFRRNLPPAFRRKMCRPPPPVSCSAVSGNLPCCPINQSNDSSPPARGSIYNQKISGGARWQTDVSVWPFSPPLLQLFSIFRSVFRTMARPRVLPNVSAGRIITRTAASFGMMERNTGSPCRAYQSAASNMLMLVPFGRITHVGGWPALLRRSLVPRSAPGIERGILGVQIYVLHEATRTVFNLAGVASVRTNRRLHSRLAKNMGPYNSCT